MIPVIAGVVTAVLLAMSARMTGFDRDRSFYPTVLIVIASYYLLFAVIGGDLGVIFLESLVIAVFSVVAVLGGLRWPLAVGLAIIAHGLFDLVHGHMIVNKGVPDWWPVYCAAVDVPLGAWVVYWSTRSRPVGTTA